MKNRAREEKAACDALKWCIQNEVDFQRSFRLDGTPVYVVYDWFESEDPAEAVRLAKKDMDLAASQ